MKHDQFYHDIIQLVFYEYDSEYSYKINIIVVSILV